jgi:hypothetical protein
MLSKEKKDYWIMQKIGCQISLQTIKECALSNRQEASFSAD